MFFKLLFMCVCINKEFVESFFVSQTKAYNRRLMLSFGEEYWDVRIFVLCHLLVFFSWPS